MSIIRPLYPEPVLLIEGYLNQIERRFIAASDLHIGVEYEKALSGINLNSKLFLQRTIDRLVDLIKSTNADGVILLGDLKSNIYTITKFEQDNIPPILKSISQHAEIYLIPGNHDSYIKYIAPKNVYLISPSGMVLEDTLLMHGHTMPSTIRSSVKRIIMGHTHPIFFKPGSIVDGQRVWVYLKVRKEVVFPNTTGSLDIIVMPSFYESPHRLSGYNKKKAISPILRRAAKDDVIQRMLALTLDGSIIGEITSLQDMIQI
jgi:metallophosphoesterase superfamily enzyme